MHIVRHATALLEDDAPAGEAAVAIAALVTAVEQQVAAPANVGPLLWRRIQRSLGASWVDDAATAVGKTANRQLVEKIVGTVLGRDSGRDVRGAALSALAVPHAAAMVTDNELLAMAETLSGRLVYDLANVVLAASEARKLGPSTCLMLIGLWRSRDCVASRLAACDLLDLAPAEERRKMIEHIFRNDPSNRVRGYCTLRVPDLLSREDASAVINAALATEEHEAVRDDLRRALADLRETHGIGPLC